MSAYLNSLREEGDRAELLREIERLVDENQNLRAALDGASRPSATKAGSARASADPLAFATLRHANMTRLPMFRNAKGERAHQKDDGSDWTPADWVVAIVGELGEAANVMKKVRRADFTLDEARPKLAREFADVAIYLDILAFQLGIDLGAAIRTTWDAKSAEIGLPPRIAHFEGPTPPTDDLVRVINDLLATGLNGGDNMRLAFIPASRKELSPEVLAKADESQQAVDRARAAVAKATGR